MELKPIFQRVIGLDIHQAQVTACAIIGNPDGTVEVERRQFGGFKKDRRALADWCATLQPDEVVMESTGIYWKSPYAALEQVGIRAQVVNARHVKQVPGRKTDAGDAEWLAMLARAGLLRGSFVPPAQLRELRLIARQRQKLVGMLASEKNRLHKLLTDGGIRLGVVVSDIHGQSARAMIKALIQGATPQEVLSPGEPSPQGQPGGDSGCVAGRFERLPSFCSGRNDAPYRSPGSPDRSLRGSLAGRFGATTECVGLAADLARGGYRRCCLIAGGNRRRHEGLRERRSPGVVDRSVPGQS